jgi:hypothetical protein
MPTTLPKGNSFGRWIFRQESPSFSETKCDDATTVSHIKFMATTSFSTTLPTRTGASPIANVDSTDHADNKSHSHIQEPIQFPPPSSAQAPDWSTTQFFPHILSQQLHTQHFLCYLRMQQQLRFQRHQQIIQHPKLSLLPKNWSRSFVQVPARSIGTTTEDSFDHIIIIFYQGGILRYGPNPCNRLNCTLIHRAAELSFSNKLGFLFWSQYSPPDAVIV